MTEDEARSLLQMYADGALEPDAAQNVERVLADSPKLRAELEKIREENAVISDELLTEALAPLRPSRSARMRLTDAMLNVHRHAEHVARTLPETTWRIVRLLIAFFSLGFAILITNLFPRPPASEDETFLMGYVTTGVFAVGISLLVAGRPLAHIETIVFGALSRKNLKPSALEVLTLEVFGILCIIASGALYYFSLR